MKKVLVATGTAIASFAFGTVAAFAQGGALPPPPGGTTLPNPLSSSCSDLSCATTKVIGFVQAIAIPLAVLMVLVGAFQMMTAGGDPEKFSKGRKTIMYAAIGLVVVIIAGGVTQIIQSLFQ